MSLNHRLISILSLVALIGLVVGRIDFQVKIEPKGEECFYRDYEAGAKVEVEWQVLDGGLLDIDVRVFQGRTRIFSKLYFEGRDSNRFNFVAAATGPYGFCFNNDMSRFTVKTVSLAVIDDGSTDTAKPEDLSPFEQAVSRIKNSLHTLEQEQSYYRVREHTHRNTAESTNARVFQWSMIETVVLVLLSIGQILYLRRLFADDKRVGMRI